MRVLWLSPFVPWPLEFGGGIRAYHLMSALATRHEVHLACLGKPGVIPEALSAVCASVRIFEPEHSYRSAQLVSVVGGKSHYRVQHRSKALDAWIRQESLARPFDVVVADFTQMAWTQLPAGACRVLDMHNIEHELLARTAASDPKPLRAMYRRHDARKLAIEERRIAGRYDLIAVPSERERNALGGWGLNARIEVIPNGVDVTGFRQAIDPSDYPSPSDIVFIGSLHYYPNEEAVLHFHKKVWPRILEARPETTFTAVGGFPKAPLKALEAGNFRVFGPVPDVRPYFRTAKLLAVPLLSGGGTRLKILEAAASGTPIVTTSLGCEGIDFAHGRHGLVADDEATFAGACLRLLREPELGRHLAASCGNLAISYDWKNIGGRFADAIERLAELNSKEAHS